ncbi:MAG: hypothetical protein HC824_10565 [Synechococcales cyanobacterium RM1_1_8]|nr:hypothetical protein [Synechococcales cyanobacterium RM1_1_8]
MSQLTINLAAGSVAFDCSESEARALQAALGELMGRLKTLAAQPAGAAAGQRPAPLPPLEYKQRGDLFLEVFCNPNIWPSPFAAKVLLTLKSDRIRLNTEVELSRLMEDLGQFLDSQS